MKKLNTSIKICLLVALLLSFTGCTQNTPEDQSKVSLIPQTQAHNLKPKNYQAVPVLMFHYIRSVDKKNDLLGFNLSTDPKLFEKILQYLVQHQYHTIHAQDLLNPSKILPHSIILSFDDGYQDFYTTAWPLLQKYHCTASEAIISGRMDGNHYMSPKEIQKIAAAGIEILSHTVHHVDLSKDPNAEKEITQSKKELETLLGKNIIGFVYPAGKYNKQTIDSVKKAGYQLAFTTKPGFSNLIGDLFELHRIRIDNRKNLEKLFKKMHQESNL